MKSAYALVALGSVLSGVESKLVRWANDKRDADWRPAQATVAVDQLLHGMSPKPTIAPRVPDAAPDHILAKRNTTDNTCAYISGIQASSLYCDSDNACVYDSIAKYIGCCADVSLTVSATGTFDPCPIWTTCFDSSQSASFTTDNGKTLYCGQSTYPVCIQHLYQDPRWTGYTLWGCARSQRTDFVYYTPTQLTSTTSSTSSRSTSSSTTSTDDTSSSSSASPTQSADPSTSTSPVPVAHSKSTPVGAIVGGVVGGVGALALIGLALFFLLRKKKSGGDAAAPAAGGGTTPAPGQGPPPPGAPVGGYYDPNQPQMAQQQQQYGGYGPAGFAPVPVDPRHSIAKPPYAVQQTEYNPNPNNPAGFSPPGSPAPAYNGAPGQVSPDSTGYGQQPYQAGQYGQQQQYQNPSPPPQQAQPYGAHPQQQQHFAAELPTQRGDGEVRELAG